MTKWEATSYTWDLIIKLCMCGHTSLYLFLPLQTKKKQSSAFSFVYFVSISQLSHCLVLNFGPLGDPTSSLMEGVKIFYHVKSFYGTIHTNTPCISYVVSHNHNCRKWWPPSWLGQRSTNHSHPFKNIRKYHELT